MKCGINNFGSRIDSNGRSPWPIFSLAIIRGRRATWSFENGPSESLSFTSERNRASSRGAVLAPLQFYYSHSVRYSPIRYIIVFRTISSITAYACLTPQLTPSHLTGGVSQSTGYKNRCTYRAFLLNTSLHLSCALCACNKTGRRKSAGRKKDEI